MNGVHKNMFHADVTVFRFPPRRACAAAFLMLAGLLFSPQPTSALSFADARHLAVRTGFGAAPDHEVRVLMPLSFEAAVDHLLKLTRTTATTPPPTWTGTAPPSPKLRKSWDRQTRKSFRKQQNRRGRDLKAWWLQEMISTPSAFTERMVVFWHNHFTSSLRKVKWPDYLYSQNTVLRRHAFGNFRTMLKAMATDPAMLIYLDGRKNKAGRPNENFARELLELFTMGEGQGYTEHDIREAARAFTGWRIDRKNSRAVFRPKHHDGGAKTVLGQHGHLNGDAVIDIILARPEVAERITRKLWRVFVSEQPHPPTVQRLAKIFRNSGYEVRPLVKGLLMSAAFRDSGNRAALIKSPLDLIVGTVRLTGVPAPAERMTKFTKAMGQDVFNPPNVKGWPGGRAWVTTASLPARQRFLKRAERGWGQGPAIPNATARLLRSPAYHVK